MTSQTCTSPSHGRLAVQHTAGGVCAPQLLVPSRDTALAEAVGQGRMAGEAGGSPHLRSTRLAASLCPWTGADGEECLGCQGHLHGHPRRDTSSWPPAHGINPPVPGGPVLPPLLPDFSCTGVLRAACTVEGQTAFAACGQATAQG